MSVVMAGLSPHPPLIIPEIGGEDRKKVSDTINSLRELSSEIASIDPEVILTISPHGSVFRDAISVLSLPVLKGDFSQFGVSSVKFTKETDMDFIRELDKIATENGKTLVKLDKDNSRNYNLNPELDHGVMVPLFYLEEAGVDSSLVPLSMGLMEYNELYEFGHLIKETAENLHKKTVIITSGDLSHRLKPGAPAGYNPRGKEFDNKLVEYLKSKEFESILNMDPALIEKAGECGLRPLIMMLGAIREFEVKVDMKSYEGPFGVGYAVAGFYLKEKG